METADKRFLVDTSPDLRQQLLREDVHGVDVVLYTHAHADHMNGIDDLRGINKFIKKPLPIYGNEATHRHIEQCFGYTLKPLPPDDKKIFVRPVLEMNEFLPGDDLDVFGVKIGTFEQDHGFSKTVGFRFGRTVYSTDLKDLTEDVLNDLEAANLDVWIIGTFRWDEHWTHAHVDLALKWISRVKPKKVILTHLGPDIDYAELKRQSPENVTPAFDGMTVMILSEGGEIQISD